jgi:hypothetical protein
LPATRLLKADGEIGQLIGVGRPGEIVQARSGKLGGCDDGIHQQLESGGAAKRAVRIAQRVDVMVGRETRRR